jgi:hypothetical protein
VLLAAAAVSLLHQVPALASVAILSWVAAGAILGDYAMLRDPDENPLSNAMGWPIFQAVVNAMITWALAMVRAPSKLGWLQQHSAASASPKYNHARCMWAVSGCRRAFALYLYGILFTQVTRTDSDRQHTHM